MNRTKDSMLRRLVGRRESGLLFIILLICVAMTFASKTFAGFENTMNVAKQITLVTIVAVGQTFIITTGGIDLSVGGIIGISSIVLSMLLKSTGNIVLSVAACIAVGILVGACNGFLITRLQLPPFIITLGMQSIANGLIMVLTKGYAIVLISDFITWLGQGSLFGVVPVMVVILPIVVVVFWFLLDKTVFGNHVKAIGGNETAAKLSGINVNRTKLLVYSLCGFLCGLAGVIMTGRLNGGNPNAGLNYDMNSIAAVIVGGTSLNGGYGTVIGTLFGSLLMGLIRNGLVLLNVNMYWQTVATGAIIILVCAIDKLADNRRNA